MLWLLLGLGGALVAIHMARPKVKRTRISSAAFFKNLPAPRLSGGRLTWGKPELTGAFLLRLLVFLLIVAALFAHLLQWRVHRSDHVGLWVLLDTSASMSAGNHASSERAKRELNSILEQISQQFPGAATSFRISAFDLERRDLPPVETSDALANAMAGLQPRMLGTDPGLVRAILETPFPENVTHLLVLSDQPAPDIADPRLIWRCVGGKLPNAGMGSLSVIPDVFTGGALEVLVGLNAFGPARSAGFTVTGPDDKPLLTLDPIPWQGDPENSGAAWTLRFPIEQAGTYTLAMTGEDGYPVDDRIELDLDPGGNLKVNWQAPPNPLFDALNWRQDVEDPALTVTTSPDKNLDGPSMILAKMNAADAVTEIGTFREGHALLADINLDALEQLGLQGIVLPPGFRSVVSTTQGQSLIAESDDQNTILIPAFPERSDQEAEKITTTLFFNATRALFQSGQNRKILSLTSPAEPEPGPNRIAIHPNEGNLWREPVSVGSTENLAQTGDMTQRYPLWALFLVLAALVMIVERISNLVRS